MASPSNAPVREQQSTLLSSRATAVFVTGEDRSSDDDQQPKTLYGANMSNGGKQCQRSASQSGMSRSLRVKELGLRPKCQFQEGSVGQTLNRPSGSQHAKCRRRAANGRLLPPAICRCQASKRRWAAPRCRTPSCKVPDLMGCLPNMAKRQGPQCSRHLCKSSGPIFPGSLPMI